MFLHRSNPVAALIAGAVTASMLVLAVGANRADALAVGGHHEVSSLVCYNDRSPGLGRYILVGGPVIDDNVDSGNYDDPCERFAIYETLIDDYDESLLYKTLAYCSSSDDLHPTLPDDSHMMGYMEACFNGVRIQRPDIQSITTNISDITIHAQQINGQIVYDGTEKTHLCLFNRHYDPTYSDYLATAPVGQIAVGDSCTIKEAAS